jgi:predicted ABC-type sugar transport system permease subunit
MAEAVEPMERRGTHQAEAEPRYRLLQAALVSLRAGPALILLILVVAVSLTTPVFFTSRNIGNVFSQTAVIAVLALGQLLVIVTRGIDLSVGSTVALSGVVGAIVFLHVHSTALVILAILATGLANSHLTAIYSACGPPALGAIQSIKNAGMTGKVVLVGFDGLPDEVKAVKAGTENATVAQHPAKIGSLGIATLYAAVQGKKVPKNVDTGTSLIK